MKGSDALLVNNKKRAVTTIVNSQFFFRKTANLGHWLKFNRKYLTSSNAEDGTREPRSWLICQKICKMWAVSIVPHVLTHDSATCINSMLRPHVLTIDSATWFCHVVLPWCDIIHVRGSIAVVSGWRGSSAGSTTVARRVSRSESER